MEASQKASGFALSLGVSLVVLSACTHSASIDPKTQVTVLTYSGLGAKSGFLHQVKNDFKSRSQCELQIESTLGAAQLLSYLEEPRQQARIDVVMGIDELLFDRAKNFLYPVSPVKVKMIPLVAPHAKAGFYPMDYSSLSMIFKKSAFGEGRLPIPKKLSDLLDPKLKHQFIIQDPRLSSPGLLFFLFADGIVKTQDLRKQWLAVAPSWDASYKMFKSGEAPMVWTYLTSLAYHASQGEGEDYTYVQFQEGLPLQVEGLAVVAKDTNPYDRNPCIQKWIEYMLSPSVQTQLAEAQWMLPTVEGAPIPKSLESAPVAKKSAALKMLSEPVDQIIQHFSRVAED